MNRWRRHLSALLDFVRYSLLAGLLGPSLSSARLRRRTTRNDFVRGWDTPPPLAAPETSAMSSTMKSGPLRLIKSYQYRDRRFFGHAVPQLRFARPRSLGATVVL